MNKLAILRGVESDVPAVMTLLHRCIEDMRRHGIDQWDELYPTQDSAVLTSTAWADGLVDNPPGRAIRRGDPVRFLPYSELYW